MKKIKTILDDDSIICKDCGTEFNFSIAEQEWYAMQGMQTPLRCKPCRAKKKAYYASKGNA